MLKKIRKFIVLFFIFTVLASIFCPDSYAVTVPTFDFIKEAQGPQEVSLSLQIMLFLTIIALGPSILIMTTCFTRIMIVISFLKQALGTRTLPPDQIAVGLALFLTAFIMMPVWNNINKEAVQPFTKGIITQDQAFERGVKPLREFMFKHTREKDIALFINISNNDRPNSREDVPTSVLIPAFIISELKTAFIMGFILYIPFLVVDMICASVLMAMGMMLLPPVMISLPFKILVFVLIDGWYLVIKSLVGSFY